MIGYEKRQLWVVSGLLAIGVFMTLMAFVVSMR
jgi:hypothetical protein